MEGKEKVLFSQQSETLWMFLFLFLSLDVLFKMQH